MIVTGWLWVFFTVIAAAAQVTRNAMQRELTTRLGTAGATHVRFLFGLPFAIMFLALVLGVSGARLPATTLPFWLWIVAAALMQIVATALMLMAMRERSFVVATAYIKTEPVQVALFGAVFLGDHLSLAMIAAIVIATCGVLLTMGKNGAVSVRASLRGGEGMRIVALGLGAGALFAMSAVGFRGAILMLADTPFFVAATTALVAGLIVQTIALSAYLAVRERGVLFALMREWRPSLFAGFVGALGSQFWFLAFALTSAANVRTLALIEVVFAQAISRFVFGQRGSWREGAGVALIVAGVALLLIAKP